MQERNKDELLTLLEHPDYRVRLESQLELATRGEVDTLRMAVGESESQLARLHGIWGLGLIARRTKNPEASLKALVANLRDVDPYIATEAAMAIHDVPIKDAFPALAAAFAKPINTEPFLRRVLNANVHLGGEKEAFTLAEFAADKQRPVKMRTQSLGMLGSWSKPPSRDLALGMWRPLATELVCGATPFRTWNLRHLLQPENKISHAA